MQTGYINVALAKVDAPVVKNDGRKNWVEIGPKNLFFEDLIKLKKGSVTQTRCINTRAEFIAGEGFAYDEKNVALHEFFETINPKETANNVLQKVAKDYALFRGFALQVIWNETGEHITEVYYQRFKSVRSGKMNEDDEVEEYYICRDWSNTTKYKPKEIAAFNPKTAAANGRQLFYYYEESEDIEYYPEPDYWPATPYMALEADLAEFHSANVQNNFALGNILTVPEEPHDTAEMTAGEAKKKFLKDFEERFVGPRAKKLMVLFGISGENAAQMLSYSAQNNDTLYASYTEMCRQEILTANGITSPVVVGLPGTGSLGGNGNELREAYELYYNTVIRPDQRTIIEQFEKLLKHVPGVNFQQADEEMPLEVKTTLPVKHTFSENILAEILPPSRLRKWIDEPELTDEERAEMGEAAPENEGQELGNSLALNVANALANG